MQNFRKKIKNRMAGILNAPTDSPEYAEGDMAIRELKAIVEHAQDLIKHLKPETKLEPFLETKISKAKDFVEMVADYLIYSPEHDENEAGHDGESMYMYKQKGLWDRIREKRERGEKPAKPGDPEYPSKETWERLTGKKAQVVSSLKERLRKIAVEMHDTKSLKNENGESDMVFDKWVKDSNFWGTYLSDPLNKTQQNAQDAKYYNVPAQEYYELQEAAKKALLELRNAVRKYNR